MSERWQSLIDRQINQMRQDGDLDNLPGAGKPLNLNDDLHTPEHLRAAYRIMKNANVVPDWMVAAQELDAKRAQLLDDIQRAARAYASSQNIQLSGERAWQRAQKFFREGAAAYNKQVLNYNLKAPPGISHKSLIDVEREMARAGSNSQ